MKKDSPKTKNQSKLFIYALPVFLGIIIGSGVLLTYNQFHTNQELKILEQKEQFKKSLEELIDISQERLRTIASSFRAFYEGSQHVDEDEFQTFSERILEHTPEIENVFVTENDTIIQSYPHKEFINKNFDLLFSTYPIVFEDKEIMALKFPLEENSSIIIILPFEYFIPLSSISADHFKIDLRNPVNDNASLIAIEKKGDDVYANPKFSDSDLQNSIFISKTTELLGYKINQMYVLDYTIWSSTFPSKTVLIESLIVLFGFGVAGIIPFLLIRSFKLRSTLQEQTNVLEKANHELIMLEKSKDEFSSMVSHELKTPLVPIMGYAESLKNEKFGPLNSEQKEALKDIHDSSKLLLTLINDLFAAQKLSMDKLHFDIVPLDVDNFMKSFHSKYSQLTSEKNIEFIFPKNVSIKVNADEKRLEQVFANLLKNAVDFVPEKGRIEIGVEKQKDFAVFFVRDNGIGIPEEKKKNLFKKFYQVDTSNTRKHGGTGLGLSICKGLIEGMGGNIWIGKPEGIGAIFYFTIPLNS